MVINYMKYVTVVREDSESEKIDRIIRENIKLEYIETNPDYVVAIGGDGTIIKASHKYPDAIIFDIHSGHLGFYANYSIDTINDLINDINNDDFSCHNIDTIICEKIEDGKNILLGEALNEVTILNPLKTITVDVYVDRDF